MCHLQLKYWSLSNTQLWQAITRMMTPWPNADELDFLWHNLPSCTKWMQLAYLQLKCYRLSNIQQWHQATSRRMTYWPGAGKLNFLWRNWHTLNSNIEAIQYTTTQLAQLRLKFRSLSNIQWRRRRATTRTMTHWPSASELDFLEVTCTGCGNLHRL